MGPSQAEVEQMKNKYDKKINKSSKKLQQASDLIKGRNYVNKKTNKVIP